MWDTFVAFRVIKKWSKRLTVNFRDSEAEWIQEKNQVGLMLHDLALPLYLTIKKKVKWFRISPEMSLRMELLLPQDQGNDVEIQLVPTDTMEVKKDSQDIKIIREKKIGSYLKYEFYVIELKEYLREFVADYAQSFKENRNGESH